MIERLGDLALKGLAGVREFVAGRMSQWLWITVLLVAGLCWVSLELAGPLIKVLAKMTLGASLGYWVDRTAFGYARPHEALDAADKALGTVAVEHNARLYYDLAARYMLRRAVIIGCCIVGSTMGL